MIVMTRYRVPAGEREAFLADASVAARVLSGRAGCVAVRLGRAVDDGDLWLLQSEWRAVGDYRRALSSTEVKLHVVPLLSRCLDEPSAYEIRLDAVRGDAGEVPGALADDR